MIEKEHPWPRNWTFEKTEKQQKSMVFPVRQANPLSAEQKPNAKLLAAHEKQLKNTIF